MKLEECGKVSLIGTDQTSGIESTSVTEQYHGHKSYSNQDAYMWLRVSLTKAVLRDPC